MLQELSTEATHAALPFSQVPHQLAADEAAATGDKDTVHRRLIHHSRQTLTATPAAIAAPAGSPAVA